MEEDKKEKDERVSDSDSDIEIVFENASPERSASLTTSGATITTPGRVPYFVDLSDDSGECFGLEFGTELDYILPGRMEPILNVRLDIEETMSLQRELLERESQRMDLNNSNDDPEPVPICQDVTEDDGLKRGVDTDRSPAKRVIAERELSPEDPKAQKKRRNDKVASNLKRPMEGYDDIVSSVPKRQKVAGDEDKDSIKLQSSSTGDSNIDADGESQGSPKGGSARKKLTPRAGVTVGQARGHKEIGSDSTEWSTSSSEMEIPVTNEEAAVTKEEAVVTKENNAVINVKTAAIKEEIAITNENMPVRKEEDVVTEKRAPVAKEAAVPTVASDDCVPQSGSASSPVFTPEIRDVRTVKKGRFRVVESFEVARTIEIAEARAVAANDAAPAVVEYSEPDSTQGDDAIVGASAEVLSEEDQNRTQEGASATSGVLVVSTEDVEMLDAIQSMVKAEEGSENDDGACKPAQAEVPPEAQQLLSLPVCQESAAELPRPVVSEEVPVPDAVYPEPADVDLLAAHQLVAMIEQISEILNRDEEEQDGHNDRDYDSDEPE